MPFGLKFNAQTSSFGDRHDYQGDFSEKDGETGWNAFQLRMYSARIGRWLSVDPKGQYASPYLSMGNNPISKVDPDGGEDICPTCPNEDRYNEAISADETYIYDPADGGYVLEGHDYLFAGEHNNYNDDGFLHQPNIKADRIKGLENGRPKLKGVNAIILHRTVSSKYPGSWMKSLDKAHGAHFYIEKDGTIYQTANLNISVAHLYKGSSII